MINSILNINVIEPSNTDNWLTNGDTFSKKVYLGQADIVSNWREVTDDEKQELEQATNEPEQAEK